MLLTIKSFVNMELSDNSSLFSQSAQGFQNMVLSNLRDAVQNASLFYLATKPYGEPEDIASAWSTYVRVRDLYEEIMQNFIV